MVAFLSAGLGLVHRDFDGYRGRLRSTRVLWLLQGLAEDDEYGFFFYGLLLFFCGLKGPKCQ